MNSELRQFGPVAIGGLGGSGTRIVTRIVTQFGIYMGSDLNPANDNLWFTFLLKRPNWFVKNANGNRRAVFRGLDILEKAMTGAFYPHPGEVGFILRALLEAEQRNAPRSRYWTARWLLKRVRTMLGRKDIDYSTFAGWGWKEPNTHIYLDHLGERFDGLKYIHVVRHGLDMAHSTNRYQLANWGRHLGVDSANSAESQPSLALKFWVRANQRVLALGEELGPERFLWIRFDDLCASPEVEISRLVSFLGLDVGRPTLDYVCTLPKTPSSAGRHRLHSLSAFDRTDIEAVSALGFKIEV